MGTTLPRLTANDLRSGILEMCATASEMIWLTRDAFLEYRPAMLDRVTFLGRELHLREKRLTDHVAMQLREMPWSLGQAQYLAFAPAALERIGDSVEALARCIRSIHQEGIPLSERACTEVLTLFSRTSDLLNEAATVIRTGDRAVLRQIRTAVVAFQTFCDEMAAQHQDRLLEGVCAPRASSFFFALLDYFREIERYVQRIAQAAEKAVSASESN